MRRAIKCRIGRVLRRDLLLIQQEPCNQDMQYAVFRKMLRIQWRGKGKNEHGTEELAIQTLRPQTV